MGKSHGREKGDHCDHEPNSEQAKGFFFNSAFDRNGGAPSFVV